MAILDLVKIRDKIKSILEAANQTGGQPRPLNFGMDSQIAEVFSQNPAVLESQANRVNSVWIWIDNKSLDQATIAVNQLTAQRRANVSFRLGGVIFNSVIVGDAGDEAADDHYRLMENIEEILRNDSTLDGEVNWHFVTDVKYFESSIGEETLMRAGMMTLECVKYY